MATQNIDWSMKAGGGTFVDPATGLEIPLPSTAYKPWVPPTANTSKPVGAAPGLSDGGFNTGYQGNKKGNAGGTDILALLRGLMGNAPGGPSYEDTLAAFNEREAKVEGIFGQNIGPDSGRFGALGALLTRLMQSPEGLGEDTLRAARTRISEREAGTRVDQNRRLQNMAGASGGRGNPLGVQSLLEELRGESSSRINSAELDLDMQDSAMKAQSRASAIAAALGLSQTQAQLIGQQAAIAAASQKPLRDRNDRSGNLPPAQRGLRENRLPGESLADQIRREAAAWQEAYGGQTSPTGGL